MALSEEREKQSAEDQMLVERDGQYELVNAYDVQLGHDQGHDCNGGEGGVASTGQQNKPSEHKEVQGTEKESETAQGSSGKIKKQNLSLQDNRSVVSDDTFDASAKQREATPTREEKQGNSQLSATSTYALGGREKRVNFVSGRTKSAPGFRTRGEEGEEQKRRNEAAFAAWVASKNEELAKRRQIEKQQFKTKEEDKVYKQSLNDAAYQAWLQKKSNELRKGLSRPATSVPKVDEATKQAAFEAWVHSKRDQSRQKQQEERERRLEKEEKAKNSDPTTVDQAYKNWLHRKTMQAKEEAQLKEQYRRAFFSESRRLHKSLQCHRFEGF